MAMIVNGSPKRQSTSIGGKHFALEAGKMKRVTEDEAFFLESKCGYMGFRTLPARFEEEFEYQGTDEGKRILEDRKAEGHNAYVEHLKRIVMNVKESMSRDLKQANIDTDPWELCSPEEHAALAELASIEKGKKGEQSVKAKQAHELLKQLEAAKG